MSERELDELARLYRTHAQESPPTWMDARVLRHARMARRQPRRRIALTVAACLLLALGGGLRRSQPVAPSSLTAASEASSQSYLLQMEPPTHASALTQQMLELSTTRGD